jgi:replicative DNA helicase
MNEVPPQNLEAEQSVLGSCLIDKEAIERLEGLVPSDFYDLKNQNIFGAMIYLHEKEIPIDTLSLSTELKHRKLLSRSGGQGYLAGLGNAVPTATNILHYSKIVAECSIRRKLVEKAYAIQMSAYDESVQLEKVLETADREMTAVIENNNEKLGDEKPMDMSSLALMFQEDYEIKDEIGLKLGIDALDDELNGIGGGELIGLTGESGAGKTALSLGLALHLAQQGKKVLYFNLEMAPKDIVSRLISIFSGLDNTQLRRKTMDDSVVDTALARLSNMKLKILSPSWMTSQGVGRISSVEKKKNGLDFIVVDHINELKDEGKDEKEVIESALKYLKPLAVRLDIPILVPFQMNYSGFNKQTPTQQDGRSSSKLSNVYGVMLSLKLNNSPEISLLPGESQVDLWITKNRHGRSKIKVPLRFQGSSLRFKDN